MSRTHCGFIAPHGARLTCFHIYGGISTLCYDDRVARLAAVTEPYIRIQLELRSPKFAEQVTRRHKPSGERERQIVEEWLSEQCAEFYDNSTRYGLDGLLVEIGVQRETKFSALREAIGFNAKALVKDRYAVPEGAAV